MKNKKLKDWIQYDFDTFGDKIEKFLEYDIIEEYSLHEEDKYLSCPINRKYIYNWCIISNGIKKYAVGFNENPALGWSYPYIRYN